MRRARLIVTIVISIPFLLVALGHAVNAADDDMPAVAGSAPMPWPAAGLHGAVAITASNGRFVVVGSGGNRAKAWISEDGLSWTKAPKVPALKDAKMSAVTSLEDGYVALGTKEAPRRQGDAGRLVVAWHKCRRPRVGAGSRGAAWPQGLGGGARGGSRWTGWPPGARLLRRGDRPAVAIDRRTDLGADQSAGRGPCHRDRRPPRRRTY